MQELIRITTDGQGSSVVSARELYGFLEVKQQFKDWIKNRIIKYGFLEGRDYVEVEIVAELVSGDDEVFHKTMKNPTGGRPSTDYVLTLGMAKELSMVERNAKGKEARLYFIEREELARKLLEQQPAAPALPSSVDQVLLQLMAQSNQLLANQQQQLDQLREEVSQIMTTGHRPAPRPYGQQLRVKGTGLSPTRPPVGLRTMISNKIEEYCAQYGYDRRDTWNYLYKRLFEVYGVNTHRLLKRSGESLLDTLERYGHLNRLYSLIMAELNYTEE